MRMIFAILLAFFVTGKVTAAPGEIVLIGHFSNIKASVDEDPHIESGYAVSLYKQDETLFGKLEVGIGSTEAASGRLYDIEFNPALRRLRFKAKYSSGWEANKMIGSEGRESRKLMIFSGKISSKSLAGDVILKDGYTQNDAGKKTYEVLKRTYSDYKPSDFEEWVKYTSPEATW
jgi:hypothetical protein